MTDKRFTVKTIEEELYPMPVYYDGNKKLGYVEIIVLLNELHEEKEYWKGNACNNSNFVNILLHELDIAQEKGYEVSDPFKKLMEKKS